MKTKTVAASLEMEACYQDMVAHVQVLTKKYPAIRNLELIALFSRTAGYCIAACFEDERDLARALAIENLDKGTADVAQQVPTRPGVDQR